jgi:hypothetical protein
VSTRGSRTKSRFACPEPPARVPIAVIVAGLLSGMFCPLVAQPAPERQPLEYQVKAAFLLNFTKFIDWPGTETPDRDSPFGICILGDDPFGPVLDQIVEGETVQGRKLAVQRVMRPAPASCQVLFISRTEKDVAGVLAGLSGPVLTVGEEAGFLREGGMIGFVIDNHRVRFSINLAAADKAGLKISSKLLNVARSVERETAIR